MANPSRLLALPAVAGLLALAGLTGGCTSGYEYEASSPRAEWESYPPYEQPAAAAAPVDYDAAEDTDPTAVATFQPVLAPYGSWAEDERYGTVWYPNETVVGVGFSPYLTAGHWAYTSEGYYWASDYEWGWAPFHYGRWVWIEGRGWGWIPGARYSPAWVTWRYGGGYIGWGPMYPSYCWHRHGIVYLDAGATPYVFAPSHSFFHPQPSSVVAAPSMGPSLVSGTQHYTPPPSTTIGSSPTVGARPFIGPDPKVAGIPDGHVSKATISTPSNVKPSAVAWHPVDGSKIAPAGSMAASPKSGAMTAPSPTLKPGGAGGYAGPAYSGPSKPTYAAPASGYSPKPSYSSPPTAYSPKPSYSSPPTTYAPKPSYSSPSGAYAPKSYTAPSGGSYAKPSYKPSTGSHGGGKGKK